MQDPKEAQTRQALSAEIDALQKRYQTLRAYLVGAEMETFEAVASLKAFKDDLSSVSAHLLTLYQLKGQRAKITWDSLFTNIDTALESIKSSAKPKAKAAIELAFKMSEPKVEEVMAYLAKLKQSL
jgi:hypothetical protein